MAMTFNSPRELLGKEGAKLGVTDWITIDQKRVDGFAEVTEDRQWIHVDVERSKTGPFGATIAHGYLTASLAAHFLPQLLHLSGFSMGVNVGVDKLRFLAPVKVGSRLRAAGEIVSVEEIKGAIQSVVRLTVEIEGESKPACVMDTISRYYME
jgi:acyl dehydratase